MVVPLPPVFWSGNPVSIIHRIPLEVPSAEMNGVVPRVFSCTLGAVTAPGGNFPPE